MILEYVDADRFSYTVLMEYVLDVLKYKEIGGLYVKKVPSGWDLIQSDADLTSFLRKVEGERLDFYVDDVVDQSVEANQQFQPMWLCDQEHSFLKVIDFHVDDAFNLCMLKCYILLKFYFTNRSTSKTKVCDSGCPAETEDKSSIGS